MFGAAFLECELSYRYGRKIAYKMRMFWHTFESDPFLRFGRTKSIDVFFYENIKIIYLLVKNNNRVNEKLRLK